MSGNKELADGDNNDKCYFEVPKDTSEKDPQIHIIGGTLASGNVSAGNREPTTRLYKKRWLIVCLFSSYSLCNSYQWIQYGIINNVFMKFYGVDSFTIDWMSMIYMLTYIPFIFPVTWLLEKKGLRVVALVATAMNCVGTWIKVASARPDLFAVTFFGQFCSSFAQVFILGMPSKIASVWFSSEEVSTACSIGVFGNQVSQTTSTML